MCPHPADTIVDGERSFFPILGTLAAGYASAIVFRSRTCAHVAVGGSQ